MSNSVTARSTPVAVIAVKVDVREDADGTDPTIKWDWEPIWVIFTPLDLRLFTKLMYAVTLAPP
jgi:hypothetical protein